MFEFTAIGRVLSTTINYHRFGPTCLLVVGRSERCSLLIALRRQRVQRALTGGGTPAETRRYISKIYAAHQMGGALAGLAPGAMHSFSGDYPVRL